MNFENFELVHKQIILDLTIRTMERDRKQIDNFKMKKVFEMWFDAKIIELHTYLKNIKTELGRNGVRIQASKTDGDFTIYTVVEKGIVAEKRYSNIALRNHCEEEIKRLLGLSG